MLGQFCGFEKETAMTVADFLIGGEGGLIVCGELCPDRDQISLGG